MAEGIFLNEPNGIKQRNCKLDEPISVPQPTYMDDGRSSVNTFPRRPPYVYGNWMLIALLIIVGIVLQSIFLIQQSSHRTITEGDSAFSMVRSLCALSCEWCENLLQRLINNGEAVITSLDLPKSNQFSKLAASSKILSKSDHQSGCIQLTNNDFAEGTYIINAPDTCYILSEDIIFHPNPDDDFRPRFDQQQYQTAAFTLGFFTAIAIQTHDIVIDLNGYEIRQSVAHNLQQRFFSIIELGGQPFIAGQGPANFGDISPFPATSRTIIRNGTLGLSAHHGIHGNSMTDILLEDLVIKKYEVAGIALNGPKNVVVQRVNLLGTNLKIPVLGTYSSARFLMPFINKLLAHEAIFGSVNTTNATNVLKAAQTDLQTLMDQVFLDVTNTAVGDTPGSISSVNHPEAYQLFANEDGFIDGNSYGILIHRKGVAVNGFVCNASDPKNHETHHVWIRDSYVLNTIGKVNEILALESLDAASNFTNKRVNKGPAGDILQIEKIVNMTDGAYVSSALSRAKIALAALNNVLGTNAIPLGTLYIDPRIIDWALNGNNSILVDGFEEGYFTIARNGDSMFHVNKGVLGVRIDGGIDVVVDNVYVNNVINHGKAGQNQLLPGELPPVVYSGSYDGGHPGQDPQAGYMGADCRGISVAGAFKVSIANCHIFNVDSIHGWAHGLDLFNDASDVSLYRIDIDNITALNHKTFNSTGPKFARAIGLRVDPDNSRIRFQQHVRIHNISCGYLNMEFKELSEMVSDRGPCISNEINFYV